VSEQVGKAIIVLGVVLVLVGAALTLWDRLPLLGKLPGDIHFKRGNFHVYVPLMTSIVLSVLLSGLLWLLGQLTRR
jgi:hypothetical protein